MVLRDASVYAMVDDSNSSDKYPSAVPGHYAISTLLQFPRCVREEPGKLLTIIPSITAITMLTLQQYWRLVTTFLYFGPLSLDLLFHVFFLQRYSRLLEESSGRSPAHFSWLILYATSILLAMSPLLSMPFLGSALSSSLVYVWSRRNPETRLSFLGLLVFTAPYLPWVLMAFSLVLHGTVPKDEMCGVVVGHGRSPPRFCYAPRNANELCSLVFLQRRVSAIA